MKNLEIFKYLVCISVFSEGVSSLFIPKLPATLGPAPCPTPLVCSLLENCPVQQRVIIGYVQDKQQQHIKCLAEVSSSSSNNDNFITTKRDEEIVNGRLYKYGVCCSQNSFSILPPSPVDIENNEVQRVLHRFQRNKRSVNYNNYANRKKRQEVKGEPVSTDTTKTLLPETDISKYGPVVSYPKVQQQTSSVSTPIIDTMTQVVNNDTSPSASPIGDVGISGLKIGHLDGRAHEDGDEGSKNFSVQKQVSLSATKMLDSSSNTEKNQTITQPPPPQQQQQTNPKNAPSTAYNQQKYSSYPRPAPPPQFNGQYPPSMAQALNRPNYYQNRNNIIPAPGINNTKSSQPQMNNTNPSNQRVVPSAQPNVYQQAQPDKNNLYNSSSMNNNRPEKQSQNQSYQSGYSIPRNYQPSQKNYQPPQSNYQPPQNNYQPPQKNYQPPQNNYQPPQNNYQPPQKNYQPPQKNYQSPQSNYQPPQNNYQPPQKNYQPPQNNYQPPQKNYQPPQNNYQPPQKSYQPPQNTYQPPQNNYQPPKNNYQPPQNNYQQNRNLGNAPNFQQQQQYYEMNSRQAPNTQYRPYTQQQQKSPYASYPVNSGMNTNQSPQAFAFPIVSETRPYPGPPRTQQPQQQQQSAYKNYQYRPVRALNRQRRRSPSFFGSRRRW